MILFKVHSISKQLYYHMCAGNKDQWFFDSHPVYVQLVCLSSERVSERRGKYGC